MFADLHPDLARTEPDPEIHALILDSAGLNLALDYLPGSVTFDPLVQHPDADLASRIVWFDAFVANVDRTARNTNMLMWHRRLWLIDHGATLYFHHTPGWDSDPVRPRDRFPLINRHVLLARASALAAVDEAMARAAGRGAIEEIVNWIPDAWLSAEPGDDPARLRAGYTRYLLRTGGARRAPSSRRPSVPAEYTYDYAIVRIVPRVERGEQINVGVILSCVDVDFLEARIALDPARLLALDPALDLDEIRAGLARFRGLRRRTGSRADRDAAAAGAVPLAGLAAQHRHPDVRRPHRALRRSGRRARAAARHDGETGRGLESPAGCV